MLQDASVTVDTAGVPITTDFLFNSLASQPDNQDKREIRFDLTS